MVLEQSAYQPGEKPLRVGFFGHEGHGKTSLLHRLVATYGNVETAESEVSVVDLDSSQGFPLTIADTPMILRDVSGAASKLSSAIALASDVDLAVLVIATDQGIQNQTREHRAILETFSVDALIVALTKVDKVDPSLCLSRSEEVSKFLDETIFAGAPIVSVSTLRGEGLEEFAATLSSEWQSLRLLPPRPHRSQTSHHEYIHEAQVEVGNTPLARKCDSSLEVDGFDGVFRYQDPLGNKEPLHAAQTVLCSQGANETIATLHFMNGLLALAPHEIEFVSLSLSTPLPLASKDAFILRSATTGRLLGGGNVLLCPTSLRESLSASELLVLTALAEGDDEAALLTWLGGNDLPCSFGTIAARLPIGQARLERALIALSTDDAITVLPFPGQSDFSEARFMTPALERKLFAKLDTLLQSHHLGSPDEVGMSRSLLKERLMPRADETTFESFLVSAEHAHHLLRIDDLIAQPSSVITNPDQQRANALRVLRALEVRSNGSSVLDLSVDLAMALASVRSALDDLQNEGNAVAVSPERFYSARILGQYQSKLYNYLLLYDRATQEELKEALTLSTPYLLELLAYFVATDFIEQENDLYRLKDVL